MIKRSLKIKHEFVELIPKERQPGIIYVSIPYATAVHDCFCGCGTKVVTPIRPTGWQLTYDGESVSLFPSVGNWAFPCRSHYWIKRNRVVWAGDMTPEEIDQIRARDRAIREAYYGEQKSLRPDERQPEKT
jgi:hypothetical protein